MAARLAGLRSAIILVLSITSFRSAIADWNDVPTGSMKPTILEGDRVIVNKLAYDLKVPFTTLRLASWESPQRGDVVVFFSPEDDRRLIKRVVAVPGDVLEVQGKRLVLNGEPLEYELGSELALDDFEAEPEARRLALWSEHLGERTHPVLVDSSLPGRDLRFEIPEDHYFMMGDNRDDSRDSRWFGPVPRERIVGRAEAVALSVDPGRGYRPRWARFFTSLP